MYEYHVYSLLDNMRYLKRMGEYNKKGLKHSALHYSLFFDFPILIDSPFLLIRGD